MAKKISDTVARLIALSRPAYVNGRWQKPAIGHAELHYLRKRLVVAGEYWPPKPLDNLAQQPPVKLTARERNRPARYGMKSVCIRMRDYIIDSIYRTHMLL